MIIEKKEEIGPAAILCCPWQHSGGIGILGAGAGHHTGVETLLGRAKQCGNHKSALGTSKPSLLDTAALPGSF